ncbi:putative DNA binding domain-containing protein [Fervidobacterium pennivorans subsp. shakshaketiis]|uniref:RNA-binding domain-containing protein n=1 Tax=Fervidobacterium pennivorans TaxID=93466 RepID=UPI00355B6CAF
MVEEIVKNGESETVEFKSDKKGQLKLETIIEAVVCLANHKGGYLLLGVEDDGTVTGTTRLKTETIEELRAKIYARTRPHLWVKIWVEAFKQKEVLIIQVPRQILTATADGKYLRRGIQGDGRPACLPLEPHEILSLLSLTGQKDITAERLDMHKEALDDFAVELILKITRENQPELRNFSDEEVLRISGILTVDGRITLAGLLVCGKENILRALLPFHEVIFNYFDGTELKAQRVYHTNLIKIFTELIELHKLYNRGIGEIIKNGIRYEIPLIEAEAYREAVANALIHRDFSSPGAVSISWHQDGRLVVSNPGGFVEGVTVENILSIPPYPRNPLLSEIFRRTGIVEKTGRGVDKIFVGQAKYGKPLPVWNVDRKHVSVTLIGSKWEHLIAEKLLGESLMPEEVLILYQLYKQGGRTNIDEISRLLQRHKEEVLYFLDRLQKRKLLEIQNGIIREKEQLESKAKTHEEIVIQHIRSHGTITRSEVARLLGVSPSTALRILQKLTTSGKIKRIGTGGAARYVLNK